MMRNILILILCVNLAFQTFVVNTLINLKYEINNISNVVQANHLNIDCLLANANKNPSIDISNIECNMFPIEKDEDFYNFEKKIKIDNGFRESLVNNIAFISFKNYILYNKTCFS